MLNKKDIYFIMAIIAISALLIIFTNQATLKDFPNSADEYVYLTMAKTFSQGKLSVSSPQNKEFFDFFHIINDGKFYGKYPPGWPLFLSLGVLIKFPMIINLLFAILTLLIIYFITKEIGYSAKTANTVLLLMSINPYFIFNSASYFSHSSALFFSSLSAYIYIKNLKSSKISNFFLLGITLGILFNIRLLDSAIILSCLLGHYLYTKVKYKAPLKHEIKHSLLFLAGFLIFLIIFFLYNYLQTGNSFLMPFTKYNVNDKLGFNNGYSHSFSWALYSNLFERLIQLTIWIPFSTILISFYFLKKKENRGKEYLLLLILILFFITYFFYAKEAGNQYGPRYLYSSSFTLFILTALGINQFLNKIRKIILFIVIISNLMLTVIVSPIVYSEVNQRTALYRYVEDNQISNAIVFLDCFLCSGKMPAKDLTRNDIYFNNNVLYINSYGKENIRLMRQYPERQHYSWQCEDIKTKHYRFIDIWISQNINCSLEKMDDQYYKGKNSNI